MERTQPGHGIGIDLQDARLAEAARIVLASSGAHTPGIDGMDKQRMQTGLAEHLASLHTDLLSGNYTPQPVRPH